MAFRRTEGASKPERTKPGQPCLPSHFQELRACVTQALHCGIQGVEVCKNSGDTNQMCPWDSKKSFTLSTGSTITNNFYWWEKKKLFEILQLKKLFGGSCTSRHKTDVFHCSFIDKMFSVEVSVIRNFLFCQDFHLLGPTLGTFSVLVGLAKLWYCGRKMVWGRQRKKCWNWVDCKSLMSKLTKATTGFGNILSRTLIPWRIILYQPETLKATAKCLLASAPALKLLIWGTWVCAQFLCCGFQEKNSVTAFQLLLQAPG